MSSTTDFIAELIRAANSPITLGIDERRRLIDRGVRMVREMRVESGVRPGRRGQDPLRDIEIAALMAEAAGNNDDLKVVLLDLADMIRTLKIVLDAKAEDLKDQ
ncbi:hypothetical protein [Pararhizobium sp. DWP3-4]|uniref:hypothetical protein n=1 Tax=Pararhizobium sp. DWP3-4 TaxID=2804565 RepID=UPI003CF0645A